MKLQVTQENLNKALNTVARTASTRGTLPILSNVLIKTDQGRLSLSATNLDIAITQHTGAKIEAEGAITVPARLMQDFISSLPAGVINLELTENKLHITTDHYQSSINGVPAEEFPIMPAIKKTQSWQTDAKDFKDALARVVLAASTDDARPVLTGVYFTNNSGSATAAATDSYRLAESKIGKSKEPLGFLVPANAAAELVRIIAETDKEVAVTYDEQLVLFQCGDVSLVARLIEGTYPDYAKLIPTKFAVTAKLKRNELINVVKVSSLFARESAGSITIHVSKDPGSVSVTAVASQLGENTASAEATATSDGEVTLNSRYLLDALNAFVSEDVEFCFNGKLEPCILRSSSQPDYLHLIMPLRS